MEKGCFLYLMDQEGILFAGNGEKLYVLSGDRLESQKKLEEILSKNSKSPFTLLIDQTHLDVVDKPLPELFWWDVLHLVFYKKRASRAQGGISKIRIFKEEKTLVLREIHLSQTDDLYGWLIWAATLPNPFKGAHMVPFEAAAYQGFSQGFRLFIYPLPNGGVRHIIFKGKRVFLSRMGGEEDQIQVSLHYLERSYPHLRTSLTRVDLRKEGARGDFLSFILTTTSHFLLKPPLRIPEGLKKGALFSVFCGAILFSGWHMYQGLRFREISTFLTLQISELGEKREKLPSHDVIYHQKRNLDLYNSLHATGANPLTLLEPLDSVLKENGLSLRDFHWKKTQGQSINLTVRLSPQDAIAMTQKMEETREALQQTFPSGQVRLIAPPYKSGLKDTFKSPIEGGEPLAELYVEIP